MGVSPHSPSTAEPEICSGAGVCGTVNATCACYPTYYSSACSVRCTASLCIARASTANPSASPSQLRTGRWACAPSTGQCQCAASRATGYWAGPLCIECEAKYWGASCALRCPCDHATCDRTTGECHCFADATKGFWAGSRCDMCDGGYVGPDCRTPNTPLSSPALGIFTAADDVASSAMTARETAALFSVLEASVGRPQQSVVVSSVVLDHVVVVAQGSAVVAVPPQGIEANAVSSSAVCWRFSFDLRYRIVGISTARKAAGRSLDDSVVITVVDDSSATTDKSVFIVTAAAVLQNCSAASSTSQRHAAQDLSEPPVRSRRHVAPQSAALSAVVSSNSAIVAAGGVVFAVTHITTNHTVSVEAIGGSLVAQHLTASSIQTLRSVASINHSTAVFCGMDTSSRAVVYAVHATVGSPSGRLALVDLAVPPPSVATCHTALQCHAIKSHDVLCLLQCVDAATGAATLYAASGTSFFSLASAGVAYSGHVVVTAMASQSRGVGQEVVYAALTVAPTQASAATTSILLSISVTTEGGVEQGRFVGITALRRAGIALPVVHGLVASTSRVVAVAAWEPHALVLPLAAFAPRSLSPSVIDSMLLAAQTPAQPQRASVTIVGAGLAALSSATAHCAFSVRGTSTVMQSAATVAASRPGEDDAIVCAVPRELQAVADECSVVTVAVGDNASVAFASGAALRLHLAPSATLRAAVNLDDPGFAAGRAGDLTAAFHAMIAADLLVSGLGCVPEASGAARCQLVMPGGVTTTMAARVVNQTHVVCSVPASIPPTPPGTTALTFAHDGVNFAAASAVPIAVVGNVAGIAVFAPPSVRAAKSADVLDVMVAAIDEQANVMRTAAPPALQGSLVRCTVSDSAGTSTPLRVVGALSDGVSHASGIVMDRPALGRAELRCTVSHYSAAVALTIVPGLPAGLALDTGVPTTSMSSIPASWVATSPLVPRVALVPEPAVVFVDGAGHRVALKDIPSGVTVQATWDEHILRPGYRDGRSGASAYELVSQTIIGTPTAGVVAFPDVSIRGIHGMRYRVTVAAGVGSNSTSTAVLSLSSAFFTVSLPHCASGSEYAIAGTPLCLPCPPNAVCDGSTAIVSESGFWRAPASTVVYDCPSKACDGEMTCMVGFTGPLCGTCAEGFGRSGSAGCGECASASVAWAFISVVLLILSIVVYVLAYRSILDGWKQPTAAELAAMKDSNVGVAADVSGRIGSAETKTSGSSANAASKKNEPKRSPLTLAAKLLLGHLQLAAVIGTVPSEIPEAIASFFGVEKRSGSPMSFDFTLVTCVVAGTQHDKVYAILAAVVIVTVCAVLMRVMHVLVASRSIIAWTSAPDDALFKSSGVLDAIIGDGGHEPAQGSILAAALRKNRQSFGGSPDHIPPTLPQFPSVGQSPDSDFSAVINAPAPRETSVSFDRSPPSMQRAASAFAALPLVPHTVDVNQISLHRRSTIAAPDLAGSSDAEAASDLSGGPVLPGSVGPGPPRELMVPVLAVSSPPVHDSVLSLDSLSNSPKHGSHSHGSALFRGGSSLHYHGDAQRGVGASVASTVNTKRLFDDLAGPPSANRSLIDAPTGHHVPAPATAVAPSLVTILDPQDPGHAHHTTNRKPSLFAPRTGTPPPIVIPGTPTAGHSSLGRKSHHASAAHSAHHSGGKPFDVTPMSDHLIEVIKCDHGDLSVGSSRRSGEDQLFEDDVLDGDGMEDTQQEQGVSVWASRPLRSGFIKGSPLDAGLSPAALIEFAVVALVVALFLAYPSAVEAAAGGIRCRTVDRGPTLQPLSLLAADLGIVCGAGNSDQQRLFSGLVLIALGAGAPCLAASFVGLIAHLLRGGDMAAARRVMYYTTGGYKPKRWWWESVLLARKAAIVALATVVTPERLNLATLQWALLIATWLAFSLRPFAVRVLSRLELASVTTLLVTAVLSALLEFSKASSFSVWLWGIAQLVVNAGVVLYFVVAIGRLGVAQLPPRVRSMAERMAASVGAVLAERQITDLVRRLHATPPGSASSVRTTSTEEKPMAAPHRRQSSRAVDGAVLSRRTSRVVTIVDGDTFVPRRHSTAVASTTSSQQEAAGHLVDHSGALAARIALHATVALVQEPRLKERLRCAVTTAEGPLMYWALAGHEGIAAELSTEERAAGAGEEIESLYATELAVLRIILDAESQRDVTLQHTTEDDGVHSPAAISFTAGALVPLVPTLSRTPSALTPSGIPRVESSVSAFGVSQSSPLGRSRATVWGSPHGPDREESFAVPTPKDPARPLTLPPVASMILKEASERRRQRSTPRGSQSPLSRPKGSSSLLSPLGASSSRSPRLPNVRSFGAPHTESFSTADAEAPGRRRRGFRAAR